MDNALRITKIRAWSYHQQSLWSVVIHYDEKFWYVGYSNVFRSWNICYG